jgi:hypothetical protein
LKDSVAGLAKFWLDKLQGLTANAKLPSETPKQY